MIGGLLRRKMEIDAEAFMVEKIKNFKGAVIGRGENSILCAEFREVDGFQFLGFKILSPLNIKVYQGCDIEFSGHGKTLKIESDSLEIETDFSKSYQLGITEFDIDLEDDLIQMIQEDKVQTIGIKFKKKSVVFSVSNLEYLKKLAL